MWLDFQQSTEEAFVHGLLQGMASPFSIFRSSPPPLLPKIDPVLVQPIDSMTALAQDWQRVGIDMRTVIDRYAQEKRSQAH